MRLTQLNPQSSRVSCRRLATFTGIKPLSAATSLPGSTTGRHASRTDTTPGPHDSRAGTARGEQKTPAQRVDRGSSAVSAGRYLPELLLDDGKHVASRQHEVFLAVVLHFGATVLGVDDDVANRDIDRHAVAVVVNAAGANCDDFAFLRLFLRGVWDNQAGRGGLLGFERLDDNPVFERLNGDRHCGPHLRIFQYLTDKNDCRVFADRRRGCRSAPTIKTSIEVHI